jgi:hypothetical protein
MTFNVRAACATLLCLMALSAGFAQQLHDVSFSNLKTKGVVIAIPSDNPFRPSAVVRLERTSTDYQRQGFFRIGLMPIAVFEGVTIEIQNAGSISNSLSSIHKCFCSKGSDRVELRRVKIFWADTKSLAIGIVRIGQHGKWELSDGVELMGCGRKIKANHAVFQVLGPQTGELVLDNDSKSQGALLNYVCRPFSEGNNP